MGERVYFGDFRLYGDVEDFDVSDERGLVQTFQGVEREDALVVALSSNFTKQARVETVGVPNTADRTRAGFNALKRALRSSLRARSQRADPLVYVRDDSTATTVAATGATIRTAAAHGFTTGDYALIVRPGLGLFTLAQVTVVDADEFTCATTHAVLAGDVVVRADEWYKGMVYAGLAAQMGSDKWFAGSLVYSFVGTGAEYARATASVGA